MSNIYWCKNCLNASTRPRITFDERGFCNACIWSEEKKNIDWSKRNGELKKIITEIKNSNNIYDCIVPVSGGKDGSYVSYKLQNEYNLRPLTITVRPPLESDIGNYNLKSFIDSGYDHIHVSPNKKIMQYLNKYGFIEKGFPYYGWLIAIHTVILRFAVNFHIPLIFYGEDGEVEYGGSNLTKNKPFYDVNYERKIYLEGGYEKVLSKLNAPENELYFFQFPNEQETKNLKITHWSYFESWDSYRNYLVAKDKCGLTEKDNTNLGTFTNFAQNDQALYDLHTYLMYLKFGFGRATQDAGIEIRRGAMTRDQALNLVNLYDGYLPKDNLEIYLNYFEITQEKFDKILSKWVNKDLFYFDKNIWKPKFKVE